MPVGMIIWLSLCGLVGLTWMLRHGALSRAARRNRRLSPESHPRPGPEAPKLSVLVAAKDEEENIETCVRTLIDQDYPCFELIAVDDRSTDGTPAILDRIQSEHPDVLQVVHVKDLPDGWCGKNNAMHIGVSKASGDWLCFVDADCRQTSPKTLSMAVQEALANEVDFLSVLPVLETKSFWERVIQPECAAIMVIWFNPEKVNDPASTAAYANGAFMLMSRDTYETIGGHESVRAELNEDMHMAQLAKERGRRIYVVENEGLYLTRMYSSFREAWRGWSRIFYGCFKTFRRLALTLGVVLVMSIFPYVSLAVAAVMYAFAQGEAAGHWRTALLVSGAVVVMLESVMYRFMKVARAARWAWLTYPVGAVLGAGMLMAAMRKVRGATTTWRGTTYRGEKHEDAEPEETPPLPDAAGEPAADVA